KPISAAIAGGGSSPAIVCRILSSLVPMEIWYASTPSHGAIMFDLEEFLHHHARVRERTRRVASCIPAEHLQWTYKPRAYTRGARGQSNSMPGLLDGPAPPLYGMTATEVQSRAVR